MLETARRLAAKRSKNEQGFTLIELMVVVLIIAVLLAIAVPTFLGAQNKAKDRSAQSSLRNSLTAAKTLYADTQTYTGVDDTALGAAEPSLSFKATGTDSTVAKEVSVSGATTTFVAVAKSAAGTCWAIKDISTSGTTFGKVTGSCNATNALTAAGTFA